MKKSQILFFFLMPAIAWGLLYLVYVLYDNDFEGSFFNSWDFLTWLIFSTYLVVCSFMSFCLYVMQKKYYIIKIGFFVFIFTMAITDFDYIYTPTLFLILLSIPIIGMMALRKKNTINHED